MAVEADSTVVSHLEELCSSKFTWEIRDAEFRREITDSKLQSPVFYSRDYGAIKWRLNYIHGQNQTPAMYLCLVSSDRESLNCSVSWSFLNEEHQIVRQMQTLKPTFSKLKEQLQLLVMEPIQNSATSHQSTFFSTKSTPPQCFGPFGGVAPSVLAAKKHDLDKFMVNNKLVIHVEVKVFVNVHSTKGSVNTNNKLPSVSLLKDLRCLLNRENKDLTLLLGGKKLKAHKLIVLARSPVLAAMLDEDKDCDELYIPDVDYDVMERVISYMYTDEVDYIEGMGDQLYLVACKYKLLGLQRMYEDYKMKSLTVQNAAQILVLAEGFSGGFKTLVLDFMKSHGVEITATEGFKALASTHPGLFVEAFCAIRDNESASDAPTAKRTCTDHNVK